MVVKNKKLLSEKGQALVEFMLFLPFMLIMYTLVLSVSSSINGAINQQKVTRGFFYYRAMNNSVMPKPRRGENFYQKFRIFGMQVSGWKIKTIGDSPVLACYKFRVPMSAGVEDQNCDERYPAGFTQFVRVGTVYGICAETHLTDDSNNIRKSIHSGSPLSVIDGKACSLSN